MGAYNAVSTRTLVEKSNMFNRFSELKSKGRVTGMRLISSTLTFRVLLMGVFISLNNVVLRVKLGH